MQNQFPKLLDAVSNKNFELVKSLIEKEGVWPLRKEDERKIVNVAVRKDHHAILKYILDKGRPAEKGDEQRLSELKYIARITAKTGCREVLKHVMQEEPSILKSLATESKEKASTTPAEDKEPDWSKLVNDEGEYQPPEEEETPILTEDEQHDSVGIIAARNGQLEILRYVRQKEPAILKEEDAYNKNIALVAAENDHWNIVWYAANQRRSLLQGKDYDGDNILQIALRANTLNFKTLKILVETEGIRLKDVNSNGYNAAHTAAECGNLNLLQYMVEKRPKLLTKTADESKTIAHIAAYAKKWEVLWYVLRLNPSLFTQKDDQGYTPIHIAVQKNGVDVKVLRIFVQKRGISLTDTNSEGYTMAHTAAEKGNLSIIRYIARKEPSVLKKVSKDGTVAGVAAKNGRWDIVRYLAEEDPLVYNEDIFHGETILHSAIANHKIDLRTLKTLVEEKGVELAGKNWLGETIAHCAAKNKNVDFLKYVDEKVPSAMQNHSAEDTVAHTAVREGCFKDMVDFLAEKIPSSFAKEGREGDVALHMAVEKDLVTLDTLKFLVEEKGFPLAKTDKKGNTIAHIAAEKGRSDIVEYAVEKDPSILATKNENGDTVAHIAINNKHLQIVWNVAEKNPAALALKDGQKNTVLHLAVKNHMLSKEGLEFLVDRIGVPLMDVNADGDTVAHIAAQEGCLDVIQSVAKKESSIFGKKNAHNETIESIAAEYGHKDVVQFIETHKPSPTSSRSRRSILPYQAYRGEQFPIVEARAEYKLIGDSVTTGEPLVSSISQLSKFLIFATSFFKSANTPYQQERRVIFRSPVELLNDRMDSSAAASALNFRA